MNDLKCPNCQNTISLWTFAKAPSPRFLHCDHCKESVTLEKHSGLIVFIGVLIGAAIGFLYAFFHFRFGYLIAMVVIGAIAFELLTYFLICKFRIGLELKKP